MKKKLAMAAALLPNPDLLFLDEPFEGVDAVTSRVIRDLLAGFVARGSTVFLTSHVLEIVERLCTHVGHHRQGGAGRTGVARDDPPGWLAGRLLPAEGGGRSRSHSQAQLARGGRLVNWQHFQAFVWLRWRLLVNQWRRAGALNAVLMIDRRHRRASVTAIPLLVGDLPARGVCDSQGRRPSQLMYAWDGLILAFLFFWGVGLVTELQRTEPLSLSKFLHLPVSVNGAFLINYLSSLLRLSLIVFGPVMLGFSPGLDLDQGNRSCCPSCRRWRLPADGHGADLSVSGLAGLADEQSPPPPDGGRGHDHDLRAGLPVAEPAEPASRPGRRNYGQTVRRSFDGRAWIKLNRDAASPEIRRHRVHASPAGNHAKASDGRAAGRPRDRAIAGSETARLVNMVLPVGWLPMGVAAAAEGRILPAILGLLGMTSIGAVSLWRAYRTTIGLYQGQPTNRKDRPTVAIAAAGRTPGSRAPCWSKPIFPAFRSRFRPSRWAASARSCGRPRRR